MLLSLYAILTALIDGSLASTVQASLQPDVSDARPNVVFILTDDQDLHMNSLDFMPNLQKHLVQEGTFYEKHYATIALCCPSRVSLWTGRAAHNTNVTDVNPPYGERVQTLYLLFSTNRKQEDTRSSSAKASMMHGFRYGCKKLVTTHITQASFSTLTLYRIMIRHILLASTDQISYLIRTRTNISMPHFKGIAILLLAMPEIIPQMS